MKVSGSVVIIVIMLILSDSRMIFYFLGVMLCVLCLVYFEIVVGEDCFVFV